MCICGHAPEDHDGLGGSCTAEECLCVGFEEDENEDE